MRALFVVVLFTVAACAGQAKEPAAKESPVKEVQATDEPGCEDALRTAAKKIPPLAAPKELSEAVAECIREQWSLESRRCVAAARDEPDLVACMMRQQQQSGGRSFKLGVDGIEPDQGDLEGGTYVVIKGNRFLADGPRNVKVYFGSVQGTVVRFASDKQLIVQAPGGKLGETVDVLLIFEPGGQLRLPKAFTFVDKSGPSP